MSGIAGLYRFDGGAVEQGTVEAMIESIDHRGPDGYGMWLDECVGVGHQAMHTTPEAKYADLPSEMDGLVITADCRIDNREELFETLDVPGSRERVPDSRLILEAYREWGVECPERLLGVFAFAIWDVEAERLFLARDQIGIKPLYYHAGASTVVFGSEIKSLLTVPEVPERLNELRVGDYLAGVTEDPENTFYEEVYRLPPAHWMTVSSGGADCEQYWKLDPEREVRFDTDEEYFERFRDLFEEAVRCRLRTSGEVGTYLSGGLDSSSVTCVARELLDEDDVESLPTFSWVFEEVPESDEREHIEAVHEKGGFDPYYVYGGQVSPFGNIEEMFKYHDEPHWANQHFLTWALFERASDEGVDVLLGGYGGDRTLSHSRVYLGELLRRGRLLRLAREIDGLARRNDSSRREVAWANVIVPFAPDIARRAWRWYHGRTIPDEKKRLNPILADTFVERYDLLKRAQRFGPLVDDRPASQRQQHCQCLTSPLTSLSAALTDITGSVIGVQERYPFLDRRLVEYCLGIPSDMKMQDGWSRYPLRRAMEGTLPESIRCRADKGDLAPNFHEAMRTQDREVLEDLLGSRPLAIEPYVDTDYLEERLERLYDGEFEDAMYEIWFPAMLEWWLRGQQE